MSYVLSIPSFNRTFAVKEEDSKLRMTHNNGIRFKLLPYVTSSSVEACTDLSTVVGRYLAKIERKESVSLSMQELITRLRNEVRSEDITLCGYTSRFVAQNKFDGRTGGNTK